MYSAKNNPGATGGLPEIFIDLHTVILWGAVGLAISQIPFIINLFVSIKKGQKVTSDNPWDATTLDWQTPTPPPHGNFTKEPVVHRNPYDYSLPGAAKDFTPQNQA
jgi:cytochrome c oxidase subunit 1